MSSNLILAGMPSNFITENVIQTFSDFGKFHPRFSHSKCLFEMPNEKVLIEFLEKDEMCLWVD